MGANNAAAELTTSCYYPILRINLIVLQSLGIKLIAKVARIEGRNHFEELAHRIYELGGELPQNIVYFYDTSGCPPASLPQDSPDAMDIL